MKKVLVLTAIAIVTASSIGCECCLFRRGAMFPTTPVMPAAPACCEPCAPVASCEPCNPCGSCGAADGAVAPMVLPGPGTTMIPQ